MSSVSLLNRQFIQLFLDTDSDKDGSVSRTEIAKKVLDLDKQVADRRKQVEQMELFNTLAPGRFGNLDTIKAETDALEGYSSFYKQVILGGKKTDAEGADLALDQRGFFADIDSYDAQGRKVGSTYQVTETTTDVDGNEVQQQVTKTVEKGDGKINLLELLSLSTKAGNLLKVEESDFQALNADKFVAGSVDATEDEIKELAGLGSGGGNDTLSQLISLLQSLGGSNGLGSALGGILGGNGGASGLGGGLGSSLGGGLGGLGGGLGGSMGGLGGGFGGLGGGLGGSMGGLGGGFGGFGGLGGGLGGSMGGLGGGFGGLGGGMGAGLGGGTGAFSGINMSNFGFSGGLGGGLGGSMGGLGGGLGGLGGGLGGSFGGLGASLGGGTGFGNLTNFSNNMFTSLGGGGLMGGGNAAGIMGSNALQGLI